MLAVDGVSRNLLVGWAAGFHRDPAEHTGRRRLGNQCASLTFCLPAPHGDPMTPPTRALFVLTLFLTACGGGQRPGAAATPDFHNPASPGFAAQAPDSFRARFETSAGDFVIAVHRRWAPLGADRFYNLVRSGYFDGVRFFRVVSGFMV